MSEIIRVTEIFCYFCGCGSSAEEVPVMISHREISICCECVEICFQLVNEWDWNQRYERWKEFGP